MPLTVKRWSVLAFIFASLALASPIAIGAVEWQVIKVNGHDYLSVDNVSKFYGLPAEVVPSGAKIQTKTQLITRWSSSTVAGKPSSMAPEVGCAFP